MLLIYAQFEGLEVKNFNALTDWSFVPAPTPGDFQLEATASERFMSFLTFADTAWMCTHT